MNCRCAFCDRTFDSDEDSDECPACHERYQRALRQTNTMPPPNLEDRPWSTSWMQDRLGVNGKVDQ